MQSFAFDHHHKNAYAALYSPVNNSGAVRRRIIAAAKADGPEGDEERNAVNFAFIEAKLITSPLHLQTAIYQAILAESQGSLRTKTVHSEILWALNPTNNITESIRRYGVSDTSTALFVVAITDADSTTSADEVHARMEKVVDGSVVPFATLESLTDWAKIKKYHKLDNEVGVIATKGDLEREHAIVDNIVVSSVAMKSVMG